MKKWIAGFTAGLLLWAGASGAAVAQYIEAQKTEPAAQATPKIAPQVESADILKQNQAERSRDQPGNLAPTYRIVVKGQKNYSSLPAREAGILIQPKAQFFGQSRATTAGEAWRQYRNGPLTKIGGWLLLFTLLVLGATYLLMGQVKLKEKPTGRLIERFTPFERLAHWTTAISFVLLAITGVTMLFGKYVLLPVFGLTLFGWLAFACKNIHNFVGPVFCGGIVVLFILFVKHNLPAALDLKWLLKLGGMFGGAHVSSGRFNGGEKVWFWGGVVLLGLVMSGSGFVLDMLVPGLDYTRANMQIASVIHIVGAVLLVSVALGHIYMGTIGVEGAYAAMRSGYVDDTWAKEHHDLWYDDIQSGKLPRIRTPQGAADTGYPVDTSTTR